MHWIHDKTVNSMSYFTSRIGITFTIVPRATLLESSSFWGCMKKTNTDVEQWWFICNYVHLSTCIYLSILQCFWFACVSPLDRCNGKMRHRVNGFVSSRLLNCITKIKLHGWEQSYSLGSRTAQLMSYLLGQVIWARPTELSGLIVRGYSHEDMSILYHSRCTPPPPPPKPKNPLWNPYNSISHSFIASLYMYVCRYYWDSLCILSENVCQSILTRHSPFVKIKPQQTKTGNNFSHNIAKIFTHKNISPCKRTLGWLSHSQTTSPGENSLCDPVQSDRLPHKGYSCMMYVHYTTASQVTRCMLGLCCYRTCTRIWHVNCTGSVTIFKPKYTPSHPLKSVLSLRIFSYHKLLVVQVIHQVNSLAAAAYN